MSLRCRSCWMALNEWINNFLLSHTSSPLFSVSVLNCRMPHAVSWLCTAERELKWTEIVFSRKQGYQVHVIEILWLWGYILEGCACLLFFFFYWGPCRRKECVPSAAKPKVQCNFEKYASYFYWKYASVLDDLIMACKRTYAFSLSS